ncbi:MAG TPA: hypothetical protein VNI54_04665 [Thermoanaerobaculia bacterium]|nr:hypothetical protein [Thermoanaerobaculia bacterium]
MAEQVHYERIGPRHTLRRRTRRTTWRCRIYHVPEERFHRADAIHVATHAVVATDFGIPVRRAIFDGRHRVFEAAWASLAYARDDASTEARIALERDCITVQCGVVGRALALGWSHKVWGWDDGSLVHDLMERLVYDTYVRSAWDAYQRERARVLLHDPGTWTRVELLAQHLRAVRSMDGAAVAAFLTDLTTDTTVVPSGAAWRTPPAPGVEPNTVLVWRRPTLTEALKGMDGYQAAEQGDW